MTHCFAIELRIGSIAKQCVMLSHSTIEFIHKGVHAAERTSRADVFLTCLNTPRFNHTS